MPETNYPKGVNMRTKTILTALVITLGSACAFAADPSNIEELKAAFKPFEGENTSYTADYAMTMDMTATGQPEAAAMGEMNASGGMKAKGDKMLMNMTMSMGVQGQSMEMKMDMHTVDTTMTMIMDMNGMKQAMKMDMSVLSGMAEKLGVPEAALNSSNMGMGMMGDPSKMLEQYGQMYDLVLEGKETVNGEETYIVSAKMKAETLENFSKVPMLQAQASMYEDAQKIYLGVKDGFVRKMTMGNYMTITYSNVNLGATVTDAELAVELPGNIQVMDLTPMLEQMYGN
jgi:hypothetical protein